ncbi:MAG: AglZ/HisF2 family acetamidino modification protein [Bacteroidia bacterium]
MKRIRVIPVLTMDEGKLVKTIRFKKPNYIGDPINSIKIFNDKEVDEIVVLDITDSQKKNFPNYKLIEEMASECFMPLAYGGAIKTLEEAKILFSLGVEKIILNSILYKNMNIITEIAECYGSQSVVVCMDVKKNFFGSTLPYFVSASKKKDMDVVEFAKQCEMLGAGEIILQNIDREGTFQGLDTNLINKIASQLTIPLVACGGLNGISDMLSAVKAGASAIAGSSFFIYKNNNSQSILINYPTQSDLIEKLYTLVAD